MDIHIGYCVIENVEALIFLSGFSFHPDVGRIIRARIAVLGVESDGTMNTKVHEYLRR